MKQKSIKINRVFFAHLTRYFNTILCLDQSTTAWNNWTDRSFEVESKIEEYRRNKATELLHRQTAQTLESPEEFEYFGEMQPKLKAPKMVTVTHYRYTTFAVCVSILVAYRKRHNQSH